MPYIIFEGPLDEEYLRNAAREIAEEEDRCFLAALQQRAATLPPLTFWQRRISNPLWVAYCRVSACVWRVREYLAYKLLGQRCRNTDWD